MNWASACDFQQFDILTSVDSDEPVQPPFKLINSKLRSVSSLTIIEYSSDKQRLWSDCAYAQAGLRLCWSHIPNCWKSHALAQFNFWKIHGIMNTLVSCKKLKPKGPKWLHVNFAKTWSRTDQKLNLFFILTFYYRYLEYKKNIYILGIKTVLYLKCNCLTVSSECRTEKWKSQREQGQPMMQTRGLFCNCNSGVTRCQSQH